MPKNRQFSFFQIFPNSYSSIILDSPSSTSALTYKIQVKPESGNAVGVNRNIGNTLYGFSTILCMEVAA